jgi:hypothetical protein
MINARRTSQLPTVAELLEGVMLVPIGVVTGVTVFPGFLLCVPGLTLLALMLAVPLVAVGLVVAAAGVVLTVAGAVVVLPRLLVRTIRARLALRAHRSVPQPRPRATRVRTPRRVVHATPRPASSAAERP